MTKKLNNSNELAERVKSNKDTLDNISQVNQNYVDLFNQNNEILAFNQLNDMQEFINYSTDKLDDIIRDQAIDKTKFDLNPDLKPMQIDVQKVVDIISNFKFEHYKDPSPDPSFVPLKSSEEPKKIENEISSQLPVVVDPNKIKTDREEIMNSTQNSLTKHNRANTQVEDSKASTTQFRKLDTIKRINDAQAVIQAERADQYKTKFEKIKVLPISHNRNSDFARKENPQKLEMVVNFTKDSGDPVPNSKFKITGIIDSPKNITASNINSTQEAFPAPSQRFESVPNSSSHIVKKKEPTRNNMSNVMKTPTPMEENKNDPSRIICVGDEQYLMEYNIIEDSWEAKTYQENTFTSTDKNSCFRGNLKYPSVCRIGDTEDFILAGGCSILTNKATQSCYTFKITNPEKIEQISSMINPRYGHCSVYCNGYVFAIGGFSMDDNIDVEPNTLSLCEKYHVKEDIWSTCEPLNIPRAYSGVVCFNQNSKSIEYSIQKPLNQIGNKSNEIAGILSKNKENNRINNEADSYRVYEMNNTSSSFIYIFGGLSDFTALDSIEKYDSILDIWLLLSVKIPIKIAKIGVSTIDSSKIIICGGIFSNSEEEFNYINTVYQLDLKDWKWSKMPSMNESRVLYQTMPRTSKRIFAIGGSFEGKCEFFDISTKKWQVINSYDHLLPENDLQTFAVFIQ